MGSGSPEGEQLWPFDKLFVCWTLCTSSAIDCTDVDKHSKRHRRMGQGVGGLDGVPAAGWSANCTTRPVWSPFTLIGMVASWYFFRNVGLII